MSTRIQQTQRRPAHLPLARFTESAHQSVFRRHSPARHHRPHRSHELQMIALNLIPAHQRIASARASHPVIPGIQFDIRRAWHRWRLDLYSRQPHQSPLRILEPDRLRRCLCAQTTTAQRKKSNHNANQPSTNLHLNPQGRVLPMLIRCRLESYAPHTVHRSTAERTQPRTFNPLPPMRQFTTKPIWVHH